MNNLKSGKVL